MLPVLQCFDLPDWSTSWHGIIKNTLDRVLERLLSFTAKLWGRDTRQGATCAGSCQSGLCLALSSHKAHTAHMSSKERTRRNLRATLSFYLEGREFWNCQREGPTLGLSFFPQQHCSGDSHHDTRFHWASRGGGGTATRASSASPVRKILPAARSVAVESNYGCQANKRRDSLSWIK